MSSYTRVQLEDWLKTLGPIKGKVLDIGGSQNPVMKRLNNTDLYIDEYKILDLEFPHEVKVEPEIIVDLNKPIKNEVLAYIAGLVDGEGSFAISKKDDKNFYPKFSITMKDIDGLKIFENVFGFELKKIRRNDGKDYYEIQLSGDKLKLFISVIYPYLKIKKNQALLSLELRNDIDLKRKSFILKSGIGFRGSESHDNKTIDKRRRIYETVKMLNKYGNSFDNVFALEVMEYVFDPVTALRTIAYFMKPNGVLYISFHFIYPAHNPPEQDYLRYTPAGVRKLLKETGFEVLDMQPRKMKDMGTLYGWWASEGMRPTRENYDKHDWAGCLVKAKKI